MEAGVPVGSGACGSSSVLSRAMRRLTGPSVGTPRSYPPCRAPLLGAQCASLHVLVDDVLLAEVEEPRVGLDDLLSLAAHCDLALVHPDDFRRELSDRLHAVADEEDRARSFAEPPHPVERLLL